MKHFTLFLITTLIFGITASIKSYGQTPLTADAGSDQIICTPSPWGVDTTTIGGQPTATGGIPPYSYKWEFAYTLPFSQTGITTYGSEILNDTSIANPNIIGYGICENNLDLPYMVLTVTDSLGNTATDSIHLIFSVYGYSVSSFTIYLRQGDSIFFEEGPDVGFGIGNLSYLWQPTHGLSDSTLPTKFWMKPDSSISYSVIVTDSVGCSAKGNPNYFNIQIIPVGIKTNTSNSKIKLYPNPATTYIQVERSENVKEELLLIYDLLGRKVLRTTLHNTKQTIDISHLAKGTYYYVIGKSSGKVVLR